MGLVEARICFQLASKVIVFALGLVTAVFGVAVLAEREMVLVEGSWDGDLAELADTLARCIARVGALQLPALGRRQELRLGEHVVRLLPQN